MMAGLAPAPDLTRLLGLWEAGDDGALEELMPVVYHRLRRLARGSMARERADHTLEPTALVHEAYLRFLEGDRSPIENRSHFFALAARTMRRLLVDHARSQRCAKRGGRERRLSLEDLAEDDLFGAAGEERLAELLTLDRALRDLAIFDRRKAETVELRYFGGLTIDETAEALGVSTATVILDTRLARAWLFKAMSDGGEI